MKRLFLLIVALLMMLSADAQPISEQEALVKAQHFFSKASQTLAVRRSSSRKAPELTLASNRDEFYVFNDNANGGYVVISGEERMPDVLAYAYDGNFDTDNIPCNMRAWMENYAQQVAYLREHPAAKVTRQAAPERKNTPPLLTCWFNQGRYYNDKCPEVDGAHCLTGCVATAMAQIMHYYQWPKQTSAVIPAYKTSSYDIDMPTQPITTIDWDNMLNQYHEGENYKEEQINAISTLMLLCGASVKMDYSPSNSSALSIAVDKAFLQYFDYCDMLEAILRNDFDIDEWEQLIYDEVKSRRPVLYTARSDQYGGHTFVLDGYEDGYFHVNWGWGGSYSYVMMTGVEGWEGLTNGHTALIGIQANSPDRPRQYGVYNKGKMTLYYDSELANRSGMEKWTDRRTEVTECIIDPSFADIKLKSLNSFFSGFTKMRSIKGLEHLNALRVTDMSYLFNHCSSLTNLDLSGLKTDKVTNMGYMFSHCSSLTNLDLSGLKTDKVTNMGYMFSHCSSLTNLDLSGLKTDKVTNMSYMFNGCSSLKSLDLSSLATDNLTDMSNMFDQCSGLTDLNLSGIKTDKVTKMVYLFRGCSSLKHLDMSGFRMDKVTSMSNMFCECSSLKSLDLSGLKTDNVKNMNYLFSRCSSLTSLDLSGFKTDNVTDMSFMFAECSSLTNLDLSSFKTDKVKSMWNMFKKCSSLTNLDLSNFKTDNVTNMENMFVSCTNLTSLDVSSFNTDNVVGMDYMFYGCSGLQNLDLSNFKTDKVTNMISMFYGCSSLTSLDLSSFTTDNVSQIAGMFYGNEHLSTIYVSEKWNMSKIWYSENMFFGCLSLVGDAGTAYDENHTDVEYARIDKGPDNPGYLTYKDPSGIVKVLQTKRTKRIYTPKGIKLDKPQKGLNIIVMEDGTTRMAIF